MEQFHNTNDIKIYFPRKYSGIINAYFSEFIYCIHNKICQTSADDTLDPTFYCILLTSNN